MTGHRCGWRFGVCSDRVGRQNAASGVRRHFAGFPVQARTNGSPRHGCRTLFTATAPVGPTGFAASGFGAGSDGECSSRDIPQPGRSFSARVGGRKSVGTSDASRKCVANGSGAWWVGPHGSPGRCLRIGHAGVGRIAPGVGLARQWIGPVCLQGGGQDPGTSWPENPPGA